MKKINYKDLIIATYFRSRPESIGEDKYLYIQITAKDLKNKKNIELVAKEEINKE